MVIDYLIELPCEPKRRFGRDGLVELLRMLDPYRGAPTPETADQPDSAAHAAAFQLRPVTFHCTRCPANRSAQRSAGAPGRAFGCFGTIHGPVSAEAEEWLIELLPASLEPKKPPAPEVQQQIEAVRELLRWLEAPRGERTKGLYEAARPAERAYRKLIRVTRLSSTQILEPLLARERVEPPLGELVCRALGVWVDGEKGMDGVPEVVFTQPIEDEDDPSVAELKEFLLALIVACSLDRPVRTLRSP
jgi:hypothetical protein